MRKVYDDYWKVARDSDEVVIRYYRPEEEPEEWTAGQLEVIGNRGGALLRAAGVGKGDCFVLGMGENCVEDLAFRLGAVRLGAVPVTINWQSDSLERVLFKLRSTEAKAWVAHSSLRRILSKEICRAFPNLHIVDAHQIWNEAVPVDPPSFVDLRPRDPRIVLFTSGTTGLPKGVVHSYENYRQNQLCFESFLEISSDVPLRLAVVNPLHHANSSAIVDWGLRRPNTVVELFSRYSRAYWKRLSELAQGEHKVVAPLVSRHFEILEELVESGQWPISLEQLRKKLGDIIFLLGSAPVGPGTVERLRRLVGQIPLVRFGSTELCLQALGIPVDFSSNQRLSAFERGWEHEELLEAKGFFIGRPHRGYTKAKIVRSVVSGEQGFMEEVPEGSLGYLVVKSSSLMLEYNGQAEATRAVCQDGWYTGLGDIVFSLSNPLDRELDYYWVSRVSGLLIRGGANYSCAQIGADIKALISKVFCLSASDIDVAVVALKVSSEHEDDCCVTIEFKTRDSKAREDEILGQLKLLCTEAGSSVPRVDWVRSGRIPRNFKGALLVGELEANFQDWLSKLGD